MKPYFVFTMLFLLTLFLFISAFFFLEGSVAILVGLAASLLTVAVTVYGFEKTKD